MNTSGIITPAALPDQVTIDNVGERNEFTLGELSKDMVLTIKAPKPYDTLAIIANDQLQEDAETNTNTVKLTLIPEVNLFDGINTYVLQGM